MFKKIFCCFLLFAFSNYIIGCYSEEDISNKKIRHNEYITEIVLPSGESVKFDDNGGRVITESPKVVGSGFNNSTYSAFLNGVKEIQTKLYPVELNQLNGKKISELITKDYSPVLFNNEGGKYNEEKGTIDGIDINHDVININIEKVLSAYTSKPDTVSMERLLADSTIRVKQLVFANGTVVTFNANGGKYQKGSYFIDGKTINGNKVSINTENILYARIKKIDAAKTTVAVLGGIVGAALLVVIIIAATKESCPFVYSFDGNKYVFDAEPLGGATTKGLVRQEYSRLEHLKETDGKYKLRVTNEVNETQFVNGISLYVVDHPQNTEAVVNNDGKVYITRNVQNVLSATDENNKDITKFLVNEDNIVWQTKMPVHYNNLRGKTRNHLTFAFKRPSDVDSINLIINAGTTLWGSNMIREMLALHGNELDNWYKKIDQHGNDYMMMMNFLQREELYELKLYLKEKNGWIEKSIIKGGGPFISERRIIPLNISNVEGDTLFFKVNPPVGFWTFDYLALDYNDNFTPETRELNASSAIDYLGKDITKIVNEKDDQYYKMPNIGNYFDIEFNAPAEQQNMERTVFLKSSGYYKIHLPQTNPPNLQMLYEIVTKPGSIVDYSVKKYIEWNNQYISKY